MTFKASRSDPVTVLEGMREAAQRHHAQETELQQIIAEYNALVTEFNEVSKPYKERMDRLSGEMKEAQKRLEIQRSAHMKTYFEAFEVMIGDMRS